MGYHPKSEPHKDCLALMILVAVAVTPSMVLAHVNYTVGESAGWTTGVDYQTWSTSKTFHVGDKLVFQYDKSSHNVLKVKKPEYDSCSAPTDQSKALTSGYDIVKLSKGIHYYICGSYGHCGDGQKLVVNVET
ncbi:Blue copper protein 1b [Linum perenne]